jgi:hypothetical protein
MGRTDRDNILRQRIAAEAARLMVEHGIKDYLTAKNKAARSLGVNNKKDLPRNSEIQNAVMEYQRLFQSENQPQQLQHLREEALQAMSFFRDFLPRLTGPVLEGTADEHSDVNLHVFAETPEEFMHFLEQRSLPFDEQQRRYKFTDGHEEFIPVYRFLAGDVSFDVAVFPRRMHQPPVSRIDGSPVQRVSERELQRIMQQVQSLQAALSGVSV